jgi:hypothetical protein
MMDLQQETTLAKVRLHWGIFIPVLLCAFVLILITVFNSFGGRFGVRNI